MKTILIWTSAAMAMLLTACSTGTHRISNDAEGVIAGVVRKHAEAASVKWAEGRYLVALLDAEHACAVVAVHGISDEGWHDYWIGSHIRELMLAEKHDVLSAVLRNHAYFPQATRWLLTWWQEILEKATAKTKGLVAAFEDAEIDVDRCARQLVEAFSAATRRGTSPRTPASGPAVVR